MIKSAETIYCCHTLHLSTAKFINEELFIFPGIGYFLKRDDYFFMLVTYSRKLITPLKAQFVLQGKKGYHLMYCSLLWTQRKTGIFVIYVYHSAAGFVSPQGC